MSPVQTTACIGQGIPIITATSSTIALASNSSELINATNNAQAVLGTASQSFDFSSDPNNPNKVYIRFTANNVTYLLGVQGTSIRSFPNTPNPPANQTWNLWAGPSAGTYYLSTIDTSQCQVITSQGPGQPLQIAQQNPSSPSPQVWVIGL